MSASPEAASIHPLAGRGCCSGKEGKNEKWKKTENARNGNGNSEWIQV